MQEQQKSEQRLEAGEAVIALAASVVGRTRELIEDGWIKGELVTKGYGKFCIHGAMNLALVEMFGRKEECGIANVCGGYAATRQGFGDIEALATAFIVEAAADRYSYDRDAWRNGRLGAAPWNNEPERRQEDVLGVLDTAADRLWALSGVTAETEHRSWAPAEDIQSEGAQQFLFAALA